MYKTVVFDLDGTLLNTLTDLADAGNRLCRKYGWPTHERQAYRYFVGNGIPKLVERLAPADQRTPAVLEAALAILSGIMASTCGTPPHRTPASPKCWQS